ncbi:MAG: serine/threonine-protein kinase [Rubripirellula sp.]|nr:serine/threonine-protein kinase [Rubripirellula sp.]
MSIEMQLDDLLYRWEELAEDGDPATPEALCADCPELAEELSRRVAMLKNMDSVFDTTTIGMDFDEPAVTEFSVPGYEMLGKIGTGGMGVVYKARQTKLDRVVAIKTMRGGLSATQKDIDRFQTEAESAAKLLHPGIVAIHEVGEVDGRHFFSMDFVEGQNLDELIRDTSLSGERAARYLNSIAESIEVAHGHGILHRDLKPSNVLIDSSDRPRISDFGLAKRIASDSKHTATGQIIGTPSYMPPEQAIGDNENVGCRSDVYALGGLLYAMLTGRPPFRADSSVATVMQVINDEPVPPRRLNSGIDQDLETICLKCLEKDPRVRYETAAEVANECQRFLNGHPIQARPISSVARGGRWCRRNPAIAILVAAFFVTLLLGTCISTYFAIRANENAIASNNHARNAEKNHLEALGNLKQVRKQKQIAEQNEERANRAEAKAVKQSSQLQVQATQLQTQTTELQTQTTELQTQTRLLRQSIHSYLKMYLRTCAIGGDVAAASDIEPASAAFARFDSREQLITNDKIVQAKEAIRRQLDSWRREGNRPADLNFAVLELTQQCRLAWETRCDAILSVNGGRGRSGGVSANVIRDLERQLIVDDLYTRATQTAREIANASNFASARNHRDTFEKLYWGELHFVESKRLNSDAVESAMVHIRKCIKLWNEGPPPAELAELVNQLETACDQAMNDEGEKGRDERGQ